MDCGAGSYRITHTHTHTHSDPCNTPSCVW